MNIKSFFSNIAIVAILMGVFLFVKCSGGSSGSSGGSGGGSSSSSGVSLAKDACKCAEETGARLDRCAEEIWRKYEKLSDSEKKKFDDYDCSSIGRSSGGSRSNSLESLAKDICKCERERDYAKQEKCMQELIRKVENLSDEDIKRLEKYYERYCLEE